MTKDNDLTKDDDQVSDWTKGLPSSEELTPLSHTLVSKVLASAFRIKHEEPMTAEDVQRESEATVRSLFNQKSAPSFGAFAAFQEEEDAGGYGYGRGVEEEFRGKRRAVDEDEFRANQDTEADASRSNREDHRSTTSRPEIPRLPSSGSATEKSPQNLQPKHTTTKTTATKSGAGIDTNTLKDRTDRPSQSTSPFMKNAQAYAPYENQVEGGKEDENVEPEDANSAGGTAEEDPNAKKARLVWTPQLHKRFVEAVGHLGIKNAVPKTIMQLMNVEGLTRENVASHLQKYRLYLKRMQGLSSDEPSPSDHLFASTPLPHEGAPFQTPMGFVRPGQFGGFEHVPFGGGFVHQAPVMMNKGRSRSVHHRSLHVQANSSSQCELPLFPTNGNRR